jgi:hypothetical protein
MINLHKEQELIMKMSPELRQTQEKMKPGKITSDGFLGDDTRQLVDIIQTDEEKAASLDLDWTLVSEKLKGFLEEGKNGLGNPITIDNTWVITVHEARGHLPCPFGDGLYRKHTASVEHIPTKTCFHFSELSLHLLSVHHFLQGQNSPFRIEPGILKKVSDW